MNTTKILCKYLDTEHKGYVDGDDILCFGFIGLVCIGIFTFLCTVIGEIVSVEVLNIGEYSVSILSVFTISNFYLGLLVLIPSIWIILVAYKTICIAHKIFMKFLIHKFIICERGD